jgi:hypothetical protein
VQINPNPQNPQQDAAARQFLGRLVDTAAERYGLDAVQREQLSELLTERHAAAVRKANELAAVWDEFARAQIAGKAVDRAEVQARVEPMLEELRRHQADTPAHIRERVLTEPQRRLFDEDAANGAGPFADFHRVADSGGAADRARRRFTGKGFLEREWAQWVAAALRIAKADESETRSAAQRLDAARLAAAEYRKGRERDYAELAKAMARLRGNEEIPEGLRRAAEELNRPLDAIFERLRTEVIGLFPEDRAKAVREALTDAKPDPKDKAPKAPDAKQPGK